MSSTKQFRTLAAQKEEGMYWIKCPACNSRHYIPTVKREKPNWSDKEIWAFNGDMEKPTFTPSINISWPDGKGGHVKRCHFDINKGNIEYYLDCTHELKGQSRELPILDMII